MKIYGIIAEYNPIHTGHIHHIDSTKQLGADGVVAVMSSNFVQRGDFAIFDKWTRAKAAILNGVDLVIELPSPYSMSAAEIFAKAGVYLLDSLGCVDCLSFGSEGGDIDLLKKASEILMDSSIKPKLAELQKSGMSYPRALHCVIDSIDKDVAKMFLLPNNTLAIMYLKALSDLNSSISPVTIKRLGSAHDQNDDIIGEYSSASYIRKEIENKSFDNIVKFLPTNSIELFQNSDFATIKNAEKAILYKLRSMDLIEIKNLPEISEGIENRIYSAIRESTTVEEVHSKIKCKRYTLAKIRRILMSAYAGIDATEQKKMPPYIRVLAMNDKGKEILKIAKTTSKLPIFTSFSQIEKENEDCRKLALIECKATDLYYVACGKVEVCGLDYKNEVIIV